MQCENVYVLQGELGAWWHGRVDTAGLRRHAAHTQHSAGQHVAQGLG
jgi:hypothetical protein